MKFVFFSRHQLSESQISDLKDRGYDQFENVNPGTIASLDDVCEITANNPADGYGYVMPGRFWVGLCQFMAANPDHKFAAYEAESRQAPELRVGDGPIPFVHVKWHRLI